MEASSSSTRIKCENNPVLPPTCKPTETETETEVVSSVIEMIKVKMKVKVKVMPSPKGSYSYTSLRDIMPHKNSSNSASWNEIPIKNPLLKHAALAYLQPMSTPSDDFGHKGGFFHTLKDHCFGWLCCGVFDTLFNAFVGFFCGSKRIGKAEEEDHHHEEEEEEEEDDDDDDDNDEDDEDEDDNVDTEKGR